MEKKKQQYTLYHQIHMHAYDFLLTIFFSQMIQQLYDYADECGGALPTPTYFILDEFANIGKYQILIRKYQHLEVEKSHLALFYKT